MNLAVATFSSRLPGWWLVIPLLIHDCYLHWRFLRLAGTVYWVEDLDDFDHVGHLVCLYVSAFHGTAAGEPSSNSNKANCIRRLKRRVFRPVLSLLAEHLTFPSPIVCSREIPQRARTIETSTSRQLQFWRPLSQDFLVNVYFMGIFPITRRRYIFQEFLLPSYTPCFLPPF